MALGGCAMGRTSFQWTLALHNLGNHYTAMQQSVPLLSPTPISSAGAHMGTLAKQRGKAN